VKFPSLKLLRRLHLYLGVFFTPLLVFYVATGWYQTVNIDRRKGLGEAEGVVDKLVSVHVDQVYPADASVAWEPGPFRVLVVIMSLALIATVLLGMVLAIRSTSRRWPVWLSLGLGILMPLLLLWLGQRYE
jgi:cyanate permease